MRIGEHPLVIQLLKGAYNMTKLNHPCQGTPACRMLGVVLSCIESLGGNESLTLKDLSQKLGLHALTEIERVSEVIAHDLRYIDITPERG